MHAPVKMHFNNTYHVELIDASTGKVKQSGDFHNLTTNSIGTVFLGVSLNTTTPSEVNAERGLLYQIRVGSGTTPPTEADTALASQLWSEYTTLQPIEWIGDRSARRTASVTFPANSSYVGNVTEVCLYSSDYFGNYQSPNAMITRALLTDSEGQQISFNKTDTDILTVTVTMELSLNSTDDSFEIFKRPNFINHKLSRGSSYSYSFNSLYGGLNLCRFYHTLKTAGEKPAGRYLDLLVEPESSGSTYLAQAAVTGARTGYMQFPTLRLGTGTITAERYYKAIAIPAIGYWKLPNESIFPAYTINGISVGVGDGSTTAFANPLCYFKKNSDKLYKNGVQLVRDVDYTINNVGNAKCLPEIAELTTPASVRSNATSTTTLTEWVPLLVPTTDNAPSNGTLFFSNANPLYAEYEEEVTFNCLACVGTWYAPSGTNGYNNVSSNTLIYLDCSVDGNVYEEVGQANVANSFNIDFDARKAKYWRIRTSSTSVIGMRFTYSVKDAYMMLNYKDPYIVFTTPPASGDVLTMDVDMDIIMKNENFVVDVGARLDFAW